MAIRSVISCTCEMTPTSFDGVPPRVKPSNYPEPFFSRMSKREKRPLGDLFGLKNFGVNLTRLAPGGESGKSPVATRQNVFWRRVRDALPGKPRYWYSASPSRATLRSRIVEDW